MRQIAIIEDSEPEEERLAEHLARYGREHGESFQISWFTTAEEFLTQRRAFDLIFFDIDLPGEVDGMEAAHLLRTYDTETPLIFVTNLAQYAVKGYEVEALDFMVKPVSYHDFSLRMDKAMRLMARTDGQTVTLSLSGGGMRVVAVADIAYVEIANHDLIWHLTGPAAAGGSTTARERRTLTQAEAALPDGRFVRVSNSCLANMGHIEVVHGDSISMDTGDELYFSRSRKRPALEKIAAYLGGSI